MTDCFYFQRIVESVSEEELSDRLEQVEEHSRHCTDCADLLKSFLELRDTVDDPKGLTESILNRTGGGSCDQAQELLCSEIDNKLEPFRSHLLRSHLEFCSSCATLFEALNELKASLPQFASQDPGPGFTERVLNVTSHAAVQPTLWERLGSAFNSLWRRPRFPLEAAYAGSLVFVVLFGFQPAGLVSGGPITLRAAFDQVVPDSLKTAGLDLESLVVKLGESAEEQLVIGATNGQEVIDRTLQRIQVRSGELREKTETAYSELSEARQSFQEHAGSILSKIVGSRADTSKQ